MQHLGIRYSQQNMHVASHITCPLSEYFSHTGWCEGDIMKGWLLLNKLPPQVGLKLETARSAGQP